MMHASQSLGGGHKGEGAEGLISRTVLDDFWEMATSEMLSVLRSNCVSRPLASCPGDPVHFCFVFITKSLSFHEPYN